MSILSNARPPADRRESLRLAAAALLAGVLPRLHAAPVARGEAVTWPGVTLVDGRRVEAADLQGVATVVVFFDTGCAYCKRHNPRMDRLVRQHPDAPLRVILAAHDRAVEPVRDYRARLAPSLDATLDAASLHAALSERRVVPLTCVIDRAGVLREVIPGEMSEDDVMGLIRWART
ncbi:TlpA disulfide reductase family protein [Leptothrix discophora]|uniref:TlpA disulfide reductase family protein n=1 Tax=Leptothrix discophora TaxID=89 RepID=A0ABT9G7T7_LEPDI|nr:TlpA disulfide reductase family protein [Leptothrix discophora]MDP4302541.1 TlpA disulfide reductase family protein [Leptothrix discophora]